MKWLLIVSSLTGLNELDRDTEFMPFETQTECQAVADRLSDLHDMQRAALEYLYQTEFPGFVVPYDWVSVFCMPVTPARIAAESLPGETD